MGRAHRHPAGATHTTRRRTGYRCAHPVGWVCGRDRGQGARTGPWAGSARAIEGRARARGRHLGRAVWRRPLVSPMGTSLRPSSLMGVRSHQPRGVQPVCRLARLGLGSLCARALLPSCCLPPARPDTQLRSHACEGSTAIEAAPVAARARECALCRRRARVGPEQGEPSLAEEFMSCKWLGYAHMKG